jgi:hypothetical protein
LNQLRNEGAVSARDEKQPRLLLPMNIRRSVGLLLLFLALTVSVQLIAGVYRGEAGHEHDEAAHFITGLMIRDYAVSGLHMRPFEYAKAYYLHYPKFALGMFPPLFHFLLGAWLLLSPGTFAGGLAFMAFITACLAWQVCEITRPEYGVWAGIATGCIVVFLPIVRQLSSQVMVDSLVALCALPVARYTARFLDSGATRDAVWLGIFAAAGCMAKGNGMGALLCPVLALLFTRRFQLLRRPGLYIASLIVVLGAAPFEWISLKFYKKNVSFMDGGWVFSQGAADFYLHCLWVGGGLVMVFAAGGVIFKAVEWFKKKNIDMLWPSLFFLLLGTLAFHILLPQIPNNRYMATATVVAICFVPAAFQTLSKTTRAGALFALAILGAATGPAFQTPFGFRAVAEWLERQPDYSKALVVTETLGEGAFISEVASLDRGRRPDHFAVRATKILARSDWNSNYYSVRFKNPGDALHAVESLGIRYVILDLTPDIERKEHQAMMERAILENPDRAAMVAQFPAAAGKSTRSIYVYKLNYAASVPLMPLTYSLDSTLGYEISQPEGR